MTNPRKVVTASKERTGLATGTGIGQLRYILAGFTADTQQTRFYDIADLLAERLPDEDKRFILYDEKSEKERLDYSQVMDLLFKFGVLPSQNELKVIYPVGFSSPYNFTDLLQKYNEQRGGLQISSIYPNTPEEINYTDLGISSSFTGVIVHIIHDSGVLGAIQDREISSLFDLGIVRIELQVTSQAYVLPHEL